MTENESRATRARHVLAMYQRIAQRPEDDSYFRLMIGLVADLAHLAGELDLDWERIQREARFQYGAEALIQGGEQG